MKIKWFLGLLLLVIAILHRNAPANGFYWDDRPLIVEGLRVSEWSDLSDLFSHELFYNVDLGKRAPTAKVDTYRPMLNTSFLIDRKIWGVAPSGYHVTNLLIHLANTILFFAVTVFFVPEGVAFGAAALFGLHPMTGECVQYIAARSDSLAIFFVLFALWIGLRRSPMAWGEALLMSFSFLFGAFVKETALVFPFVWALAFSFRHGEKSSWSRPLIALGLTSALYSILRLNALHSPKVVYDGTHLIEQFLGFPPLVGRFMASYLTTTDNMPMQTFARVHSPGTWGEWGSSVLFFISLAGMSVIFYFKRWKVLLPILWIVFTLAPPFFATSLTEVLNPRYLYAPAMGASLLVVLALSRLGMQWGGAALAILIGVVTLRTAETAPRYRSEEVFYREILRDNPHYIEAEYNLANVLAREERYAEAIEGYREILRHQPEHRSALNNLGLRLLHIGKVKESVDVLGRLNSLPPKEARYVHNYELAVAKLQEMKGK